MSEQLRLQLLRGQRASLLSVVRFVVTVGVLVLLLPLTSDRPAPTLSSAEQEVVRRIIATIPVVAKDRYDRYSGLFSWNVPTLPNCGQHWGLPLSSLDPFAAVYFKAIYVGRSTAVAKSDLETALGSYGVDDPANELFCDPLTWRGYIGDLTYKRPASADYGTSIASTILKNEILTNRSGGYVSTALRYELELELDHLRGTLSDAERDRADQVRLQFDPTFPLSAFADQKKSTITLSDALVQYAFVRQALAREDALKEIIRRLEKDRDVDLAARDIKNLAEETVDAVRRSLAFILAHELAHIFVPTIDEREADCYGLAVVSSAFGTSDIGVFRDVQRALTQGHAEYWNGLPVAVVDQRFALIEVWSRPGIHIRQVCVAAWKWLEQQ